MSVPVTLEAGNLGLTCYPTPQELFEAMVAAINARMDDTFSGFVILPTEPAVDDRDKLWYNTTEETIYRFSGGHWYRKHPIPPSRGHLMLWPLTEAELWAFDGGDGSNPSLVAPTANSGAMWEVDTTFAGKFLVAPGTLSPTGTVLAVNDTGGLSEVALVEGNLPEHFHYVASTAEGTVSVEEGHAVTRAGEDGAAGSNRVYSLTGLSAATNPATVGRSSTTGGSDPVSTVPPYRVAYVAKRTARTLIKAS